VSNKRPAYTGAGTRLASLTTPDPEKSYASANGILRAPYDISYIEPIRVGLSVISLILEGPETAYVRQLAYGWRELRTQWTAIWLLLYLAHALECNHLLASSPP